MKYKISLLFLIWLIGLANAEVQTLGDFNQNTCVNLVQSCNSCTYVNITTVIYPNSAILQISDLMSRNGQSYNYTFCNTNLAGHYIVNGFGDLDGVNTDFTYDFNILGIGNSGNKGITETTFVMLIVLIISIFVYIKISRFFGGLMIFILGFGILFTMSANGWLGWIVIGSGFIITLYALMTPKKRVR